MARRLRCFLSGYPYHVVNRGNQKMNIFWDDIDRRVYLKLLRKQCVEHNVRIWAYSLMPNHVHHVAFPDRDWAVSDAFHRIFGEYARYFNTRYEKVGHVFQGRFKAPVLDESHLYNAVAYVERNPVRAGMVRYAEDYRWSSAAAHCGLREDPVLSLDVPFLHAIPDWHEYLLEKDDPEALKFIRDRSRTEQPCASESFTKQLEEKLGYPLLPRKRGPKKKDAPEGDTSPSLFSDNLGYE
jgi:putative transposase